MNKCTAAKNAFLLCNCVWRDPVSVFNMRFDVSISFEKNDGIMFKIAHLVMKRHILKSNLFIDINQIIIIFPCDEVMNYLMPFNNMVESHCAYSNARIVDSLN